jgi:hypothetical protein
MHAAHKRVGVPRDLTARELAGAAGVNRMPVLDERSQPKNLGRGAPIWCWWPS